MKLKLYVFSGILMLLSIIIPTVKADENGPGENRQNVQSEQRTEDATSSREQSRDSIDNQESSTSTENNDKGEITSEEHRSTVATFVKSLLNVADREGGIGQEVRNIARDINDSASTSAEAMKKVEGRGSLAKWLFGEDYSSLNVIKDEIATTSDKIENLKNILASTTNNTVKTELSDQVKSLEDAQAKVNAFVKARENTFSLFGWFIRLFNR